jgi:hypothetical protein
MTYFRDLSPYGYHSGAIEPIALNVGWLDSEHPWTRGPVAPARIALLTRLCVEQAMNLMRGWHQCDFCEIHPVEIEFGDDRVPIGHAEIRVHGRGGVVYAAPQLICHYVADHGYQPPTEFLEALDSVAIGLPPNVSS